MINLFKLAALAKAASKPVPMPEVATDKLAQEQMTRRAALRRIGMTGAMTVIGLMSIDELARVSAKKLEEHEMTRGIAQDFKNAGVAFADDIDGGDYEDNTPCDPDDCVCNCKQTAKDDRKACGSAPKANGCPWNDFSQVCSQWNFCKYEANVKKHNCIQGC